MVQVRDVIRRALVGALLIVAVTACSSDESSSTEPAPTTPTTPTTTQVSTTSTTDAPTTTTVAVTTTSVTTTTLPDHDFWVEFGPPHGYVAATDVFDWVLGTVQPEAVVTVNGEATELNERGDGSYEWALVNGTAQDGDPRNWVTIPLREGINSVVFRAEFDDGTTMTHQRQVTLDSALDTRHGWIVETGSATGDIMFAVAEFVPIPDSGDSGDIAGEMWGTPMAVETYPVHPDAGFILLTQAGGRPTATVIDYNAFVAAVDRSDTGACPESEDCFWKASHGVTSPPQGPGGLPFLAYINTNGELIQLEQQWGLP